MTSADLIDLLVGARLAAGRLRDGAPGSQEQGAALLEQMAAAMADHLLVAATPVGKPSDTAEARRLRQQRSRARRAGRPVPEGGRDRGVTGRDRGVTGGVTEGVTPSPQLSLSNGRLDTSASRNGANVTPPAPRDKSVTGRDKDALVLTEETVPVKSKGQRQVQDQLQDQEQERRAARDNGVTGGVTPPPGTAVVVRSRGRVAVASGEMARRLDEAVATAAKGKRLDALAEDAAEFVFAYWQIVFGHPHALFDSKQDRVRKIIARYRENGGNVHELLYAVDGAKKDPFLSGKDPKSPREFGLETFFRDRAQVERLAESCGPWRRGEPHPMVAGMDAVPADDVSHPHPALAGGG